MISRPVYEDFFLFFQYKEVRGIAALAGPKNALRYVLYIVNGISCHFAVNPN